MPIAALSQPRRATITYLSIDRTRRPVSSRQRTNHPLEPRDRPRTPGLAPSKADPRRHPPRDRTPKAEASDELDPDHIDPIDVRTRASIPERQLDPEAQPSPRCGAPSNPEPHRIRIRSRVSIELGASSVPRRCRIGHRASHRQGVLWGSRGCGVQG
ncbi:hypothetical protein SOLON_86 [Mycobacterium phage Solon]|uniref:Uncharacterized protein n=1 Tax=Mycobacterium phage Solon TaxID=555603 RepID=B5LLT9_9CAUD|nr:hypothetical protein SOLON_86 [Mycobacterium phage Solon]ACH62985.1 hypothetical protein SOLON_86 [Mycobacterium phage Solon]